MTQAESKAKIEEITEQTPAEAGAAETQAGEEDDEEGIEAGSGVTVHNRNEKKARKLIEKLNLKKVDGISRVFFKKPRGIIFTIDNPDVYKNPSTGTYIVFGEAKVNNQGGDMAQRLAALQQAAGAGQADPAAAAAAAAQEGSAPSKDPSAIQADLEAAVAQTSINDTEVDEANVDATGLSEDDIKLVMDQANASRGKAVAALKKNNSDIVNTIMELTT
jgi:nascent polypeptide-associated complex subunit alpha